MEKKEEGEGYAVGDIIREEQTFHIPLSSEHETEIYHYLILEETSDPEDEQYIVMLLETSDVFKITFHTGNSIKHRKVG